MASNPHQRALISTGFPMRGVITVAPTFASIQVSCVPGSVAISNPSMGSTRIPWRVPLVKALKIFTSVGNRSRANVKSPEAFTVRRAALARSRGASTLLSNHGSPGDGKRFGSSPSFSKWARERKMAAASSKRPVSKQSPGNEINASRPQSANHGYPAIMLVPRAPSGSGRSTMN